MSATMIFTALTVFAVLSLALCAEDARGAARAAAPVRPDRTLVFKQAPDHAGKQQDLELHVFLPKDWKPQDKRPAIVFWFGGGFVGGSATQFFPQAEYVAGRGLVAVSADYRVRMGTAVAIQDARGAMRYLTTHAGELGIDPAKIVAGGGSAGGYLAVAMGSRAGSEEAADDASVPFKPAALVLFNPALEPARRAANAEGDAGPGSKDGYELPGPIAADFPPAICFYGTEDARFLAGGKDLCNKAAAAGVHCELWTAAGQKHGFFNRSPWREATLERADRFLTGLGYLQGPPTIQTPAGAVLRQDLPGRPTSAPAE